MATIQIYNFNASTSLAEIAAVLGMSYDSETSLFYKGDDKDNGFYAYYQGDVLHLKSYVNGSTYSAYSTALSSPLLYVFNEEKTACVFGGSGGLFSGWSEAKSANDNDMHYIFVNGGGNADGLRVVFCEGVRNENFLLGYSIISSTFLTSLCPIAMGVGTSGGTVNVYTENLFWLIVGQTSTTAYQLFSLDGYDYVALNKYTATGSTFVMRIGKSA